MRAIGVLAKRPGGPRWRNHGERGSTLSNPVKTLRQRTLIDIGGPPRLCVFLADDLNVDFSLKTQSSRRVAWGEVLYKFSNALGPLKTLSDLVYLGRHYLVAMATESI